MSKLNAELIDAFSRDGCIIIPGGVPSVQLAAMRQAFDDCLDESRKHDGPYGAMEDGRPRFDVEPDHSEKHPALRRVASPTELNEVFLDLICAGPLSDAAVDLIGPDLRIHHSKVNSKLPGFSTTVKWHQDFTYDPHSNDDLITCLVFLDDISDKSGPLRTVPSSHLGPLYSLWYDDCFTGVVADDVAREFEKTAVSHTGPAGTICIMHSRVAHASFGNNSDQARTLFIAAIAAADAIPLAGNAVPSRHAGMILRNCEPKRIRTSAFEMEAPEVPKDASFFNQQASM